MWRLFLNIKLKAENGACLWLMGCDSTGNLL